MIDLDAEGGNRRSTQNDTHTFFGGVNRRFLTVEWRMAERCLSPTV